jgi:TRAP transporter TAXI family solute receptor
LRALEVAETLEHDGVQIRRERLGLRRRANVLDIGERILIPAELYPGAVNEGRVGTFGLKATLVTSTQVSDTVVYALTREVFESLEAFKSMNPTHAHLTKPGMLKGLSATLHPGALRYYKEAGLM